MLHRAVGSPSTSFILALDLNSSLSLYPTLTLALVLSTAIHKRIMILTAFSKNAKANLLVVQITYRM